MKFHMDIDFSQVPLQIVPVVEKQGLNSTDAENDWHVIKCRNDSGALLHTVVGFGRTGTLMYGIGVNELDEPPLDPMGFLNGNNEGNHLHTRFDMPASDKVYTFAIQGRGRSLTLVTASRFASIVDAMCHIGFEALPSLHKRADVEWQAKGSVTNGSQRFKPLQFGARDHSTEFVQTDNATQPATGDSPFEHLDIGESVMCTLQSFGGQQNNMSMKVTPR